MPRFHRKFSGRPHGIVLPSLRDTSQNKRSSGTFVITKPTLATDGDVVIAILTTRTISAVSVDPTGWTALGTQLDESTGSNSVSLKMYYRVLQAGDPASWSGTLTSSKSLNVFAAAVQNANVSSPVGTPNLQGAVTTPLTTVTHSGLTVVNNGALIVGGGVLVATGYTMPATSDQNGGTGASGAAAGGLWHEAGASAGATGNRSITAITGSGVGDAWAMCMVEINPL